MGRSRHGIIGPDDPSISYRDNLYFFTERYVKEYMDSLSPEKRINRYIYCSNNPVNYIDPLGLEVEADKIGGPEEIVGIIEDMEARGLSDAAIYEKIKDYDNPSRYVYTEKDGWIDFRHYGEGMKRMENALKEHNVAAKILGPIADWLAKTAGMKDSRDFESHQAVSPFPGEKESAYSYEDLPSNLRGFEGGIDKYRNDKKISEVIKDYLSKSGAVAKNIAEKINLDFFKGKKVHDPNKPILTDIEKIKEEKQPSPIEKTEASKENKKPEPPPQDQEENNKMGAVEVE